MKRLFVTLGACVLALIPASEVAAQPLSEPPGGNDLNVEINLSASRGGDVVGLYGLGAMPGGTDYYYDLGLAVGDSLGIARTDSSVESFTAAGAFGAEELEGNPFAENFESAFPYDVAVSVDEGRLLEREGEQWVLRFDTADLERVARIWGFDSVELSVCPLATDVTDTSSRPPDFVDSVDPECRSWLFDTAEVDDQSLTVALAHSPDTSGYWWLVGILAAIAVIVAVALSIGAYFWRRHSFPRLTSSTLTMILVFTVLSVGGAVVAAVALGTVDQPVTDAVLSYDMAGGGNFVAIVGPGFLFALPFLGPALVFALAKPVSVVRDSKPLTASGSVSGEAGVPSWLGVIPTERPQAEKRDDSDNDEEAHRETQDNDGPSWWSPPS